jgi:gamma-glutamylcyclotransferase (GGCT)/AIG2-like uncharacterized protein YtfP
MKTEPVPHAEVRPTDQADGASRPDQLPLFVYGTLRRGQENYWLMRGNTVSEVPATIEQMALYSLRAYPMMVEGDSVVHGELITIHPRVYSRLLADLDQLEGYRPGGDSRFRRVERCVRTEGGSRLLAWVYLGERRVLETEAHVAIPHGDWCRFRRDLIRGTRFGRFELADDGQEQP